MIRKTFYLKTYIFSALAILFLSFTNNSYSKDSIIIATSNGYAPYADSNLENGGLGTSIIKEAFNEKNLNSEALFLDTWSDAYDRSADATYHGTQPWIYNLERSLTMRFSDPIFVIRQKLYFDSKKIAEITSLDSLTGKSVCYPDGWAVPNIMKPYVSEDKIFLVTPEDMEKCFAMLSKDSVDAVISNAQLKNEIEFEDESLFQNVKESKLTLAYESHHLLVSNKHPKSKEIIKQFNSGLDRLIASGKYQNILESYGFSIDDAGTPEWFDFRKNKGENLSVHLKSGKRVTGFVTEIDENIFSVDSEGNKQEFATGQINKFAPISSKDSIIIATSDGYAPYADSNLENGGLGTSIIKEAFNEKNLNSEALFLDTWSDAYDRSADSTYHGTQPWIYNLERSLTMRFSDPIFVIRQKLYFDSKKIAEITSLDSLTGKSVCYPDGWAVPNIMKPYVSEDKIFLVTPEDMEKCFAMLSKDSVDAVISNAQLKNEIEFEDESLFQNVKESKLTLAYESHHLLVSNKHPKSKEIIKQFNSGLDRLVASGKYQNILESYGFSIDDAGTPEWFDFRKNKGENLSVHLKSGKRVTGFVTEIDENIFSVDSEGNKQEFVTAQIDKFVSPNKVAKEQSDGDGLELVSVNYLLFVPSDFTINVRNGPSINDNVIGQVKSGQKVFVVAEISKSKWVKINYGNGRSGFVYSPLFQEDKP